MNHESKPTDPSVGDLVWVPQNTEVQKSYVWINGDSAYYPGDHTDCPLHGVVVSKFNSMDIGYVRLAVGWRDAKIICRIEDIFPIMEGL